MELAWEKELTRRDFLKLCVSAGAGIGASMYAFDLMGKYKAYAAIGEKRGLHEALFYEKLSDGKVRCLLCPNFCELSEGQRGFCRVREPVGGKLNTLVYELICARHIDPIEKKPLFHVLPGSRSYSIATAGCNSRCKYCQNWTISQARPEETVNERLSAGALVSSAKNAGCDSIAYTYTEPVIFIEYAMAAGRAAASADMLNIWVTGGKINPLPLKEACKHIDAANIDFKAFNDGYLRRICAQDLKNIQGTIVTMKEQGVWVELTNLIVPTLNDDMDDIRKMAKWIRAEAGPDVPVHFSRFWPQYKLRSLYPTPVGTLKAARQVALEEGLHYVSVSYTHLRAHET